MCMSAQQDRLALEREAITTRVAVFKATQEKFQREREEYYATTMETARAHRVEQSLGRRIAPPSSRYCSA
jgi:hypothetical protein